MNKESVAILIEEALQADPAHFLVNLSVAHNNSIKVVVDGDNGITLSDCIRISRHVENGLDREKEDFSIEVSSPGATAPIKNIRQYVKNIDKRLAVTLKDGEKIEGILSHADREKITLTYETKQPKPTGKGKEIQIITIEKPHSEIKEARVMIAF